LNAGTSEEKLSLWRVTRGSVFSALTQSQVIEKKWSGREDLNLRPPGPENGIRETLIKFCISTARADKVSPDEISDPTEDSGDDDRL
jgi:hypothetical protein